jgi:hypothetical protein
MDVNRTPLTEAEQDWIDKYRAALDNTPIPTSRLRRVRNKLSAAQRTFTAGMKRIFGSQGNAAPAARANSNLPTANPAPSASPSELRKPITQDALPPHKKRGKRGRKAS